MTTHPMFNEGGHTPSCAGTDLEVWFAENAQYSPKFLKRICDACPVLRECEEWSLRHEMHGYWAGMNPTDRERRRREEGISYSAPEVSIIGHVFPRYVEASA